MSQRSNVEAMHILPDDILQKQVCQDCYNYLSVPPVVINNQGETICGRCIGSNEHRGETKSLFNVVASGFHFKCVNHFNGCTKILAFEENELHEQECSYGPQECTFCSFSGNVSQMFNHAMKIHPENISLDGIIPLPLWNHSLKRILLLPIKDNHLLIVRLELTENVFRIVLKLITKEISLNINRYAVKFYKTGDQESSCDYGLFSINLENTIEKPKEELVKIFGLANIHCQILTDTFSFKKTELELQKRILELRRSEEHITNLKRKLQVERTELLQQRKNYDFAMEVIKIMSYDIFKCSQCQKITFGETYFCTRHHCYCKSCWSTFCHVCKVEREFSKLSGLEEIIVPCYWPDCDVNICVTDFWSHKAECQFRPYKCPLIDCNKIILSIEKLREHWHSNSPTLITGTEVICNKYGCEGYYLIIENDIYHLVINFDENVIQGYVEEYNVVRNSVKFKCAGWVHNKWYIFNMSEFCGRYQIHRKNEVVVAESNHKYTCILIRRS